MGPTVAIWLSSERDAPSAQDLLAIARSLDPSAQSFIEVSIRSTEAIGGSTHADADPRQFGFKLGEVGFDKDELRPVANVFGFAPVSAIHIFAYANAPVDHQILAELALFFAVQFEGIIDFGGNLGDVTAHRGNLISVPYAAGTLPSAFHVSDARFLAEWLRNPAFHMIK